MKLWRIAFMMLAASFLVSCSSNDGEHECTPEPTLLCSCQTNKEKNYF